MSSRGLPALGLKTFSFDSNCLAEVQPLWKPRLLLGPPGQQYLKFLDGWNVDAGVGGWVGKNLHDVHGDKDTHTQACAKA